jgi:hypothetical protein
VANENHWKTAGANWSSTRMALELTCFTLDYHWETLEEYWHYTGRRNGIPLEHYWNLLEYYWNTAETYLLYTEIALEKYWNTTGRLLELTGTFI